MRLCAEPFWKLVAWIVYIILVATSIRFTWRVLEKFAKQETAIWQYEEKIEAHPTIVICDFYLYWEYQKHFNITYRAYQSDGLPVEVILKMGENDLKNSEGIVNLAIIYTRYNAMCYSISTTRNVDERETEIKLSFPYSFHDKNFYFTSEKNVYGITRRDWRDGEVYSITIAHGTKKDITLTVEKNINLQCSKETFYEYVASRLSKHNFDTCNNTCLMTSLPNDPYPICPNYSEWLDFVLQYKIKAELDCNWSLVRDLIKNITNNDEHLKACISTQYSGLFQESSGKETELKYKFALPLKAKVYEEYFIIDSIGLIGSVGGTLGVFIGFSFSNLIIFIMKYMQTLMERKLTSSKKITKTVWKCLEWSIYLSLMATAILFAKNVIEKFFAQNTGIKQNMEKIESHPTVTICPFQEQCDGPMKLIFRLHGEPKKMKNLVSYVGTYNILSSDLINGKPYWIHKHDANNAIWYNSTYEAWIFGPKVMIGSTTGQIAGFNGSLPYEVQTWSCLNNDNELINISTDVVVELGK